MGQAARHGMLLRVECRACKRVSHFVALDLAELLGHGREVAALRFTCSECGARGARAKSCEVDTSRKREIVVWRPTRLKLQ